MQILHINSSQNQKREIKKSVEILKKGGILCFPTDTVYGLGADAHNQDAVRKIYALKKRPQEKPLILFPKNHKLLIQWTKRIPPAALKLISHFWPGPLTLIFKAALNRPSCLVSEDGNIGMRIPDHPIPQKICQEEGILLATTSANLSGEGAVLEASSLSPVVREGVNLILDAGETVTGKESTIVEVSGEDPRVLREGSITRDEINQVLKNKLHILFVCTANMCRSAMAEALFKNILPDHLSPEIKVSSAGVSALFSYPPSSNVIKVLREKDIDVSNYKSTPTSSKLIDNSDVILVMQKKHQEELLKLYPQARSKIWLLKEFARGKPQGVSDPTGHSEQLYRKTASEIEKDVRKIVERICGG